MKVFGFNYGLENISFEFQQVSERVKKGLSWVLLIFGVE